MVDSQVLFEDNHLLILNKRAGQLVHGDRTGDMSLLELAKDYLKAKYQKPGNVFLQPSHRLDRPVSGCLVFARTSKAITRMTKIFRTQQIFKSYLAVTDLCPEETQGEVRLYLEKDKSKNKVVAKTFGDRSHLAQTTYQLLAEVEQKCLWRLLPQTGRSHQLRVTMQHLGAPILGDLKYGSSVGLGSYIALHCHSLCFEHPVRRAPLTVTCPPPDLPPWTTVQDHFPNC